MPNGLTKDMVYFVSPPYPSYYRTVSVDEPFLLASFDTASDVEDNGDAPRMGTHILPKVLALGVLLIEIEFGIDIQERLYSIPTKTGKLNSSHMAAAKLVDDEAAWQDTFTVLREVIKTCVLPLDPFIGAAHEVASVKTVLYTHVVCPLENLLKTAFGPPEHSDFRSFDIKIDKIRQLDDSTSDLAPRPAPEPGQEKADKNPGSEGPTMS